METDINSLDLEIKQIGSRASVIESTMTSKFDEIEEKIELNTGFDAEKQANLLTRIAHLEIENLMRESYDKRLNLLVHGVEETEGNDTKNQTKANQSINQFSGPAYPWGVAGAAAQVGASKHLDPLQQRIDALLGCQGETN